MERIEVQKGDKFGDWVVIDPNYEVKNQQRYALCQCKCGTVKPVIIPRLVRGLSTKCKSCAARERGRKDEIIIGNKYKHWTVISGPMYKNYSGKLTAFYKVRCDCGYETEKLPVELLDPTSHFQCQSCAQKERALNTTIKNGKIGELTKTHFTYLKKSAMKRDITFEVSMQYLWDLYELQNRTCAITGDSIENFEEASLDRIDSSKGYIEGNV